jgi:DNA-directed RNA polymerase subunit alpha
MPRIPYKNLTQSNEMAEKLEMSTAEIGLSVRTTNCLEERGIFTVHDLLNCTRADLLSISNFGEKTLEEVYKSLEKIGFFRSTNPADESGGKRAETVAQAG